MEYDNHIDGLIAKLAAGTLSEEEMEVLVEWYNAFDDTKTVLPAVESEAEIKDRIYQRLMEKRFLTHKPRQSVLIKLLPYAAAAVLLAVLGIWYVDRDKAPETNVAAVAPQDVAPGGNRALLTLADGRKVILSEEQSGIVVGDEVTYSDGSKLLNGIAESPIEQEIAELTLSTPKGGTYQVTLADGTHVWLNAASTLKYPTRFAGDERVVELTGEAYFDVTKVSSIGSAAGTQRDIPFKVISNGQEVIVLGTSFNVAAYVDDTEMKTTLVTGMVKVVSSGASEILQPGQQSTIGPNGIKIQTVTPAHYIAWKNGQFHFQRTPLEEVMKQVSRWYDVEVIYKNGIPKETFSGKVWRDVSLTGVLNILQQSTINIRLEGRTLIVN